jgi:hypothetical protein
MRNGLVVFVTFLGFFFIAMYILAQIPGESSCIITMSSLLKRPAIAVILASGATCFWFRFRLHSTL